MAPSSFPTSSGNRRPRRTPAADADDFSARRSSRVSATRFAADNDTWVEALAVCEMPEKKGDKKSSSSSSSSSGKSRGLLSKFKKGGNHDNDNENRNHNRNHNHNHNHNHYDDDNSNSDDDHRDAAEADIAAASQRLALRPYFQSQNTGQRVWDEPPSGASTVVYASSEARKMAQAQLEEMRATYAMAALARRREREEERLLSETAAAVAGGGRASRTWGRSLSVKGKLFRSTSTSSSSATSPSPSNAAVSASASAGNSDFAINRGVPPSVLHESFALAAAACKGEAGGCDKYNGHNETSSYERDLQMAMLLSMGIGGGSITGLGTGNNGTASDHPRKSNKSATSSSSPSSSSSSSSRRNSCNIHNKNVTSKKSFPLGKTAATTTTTAKVDARPQHDSDHSSLLTTEEQEQLALATALSLSEEEARRNSKRSAKHPQHHHRQPPQHPQRSRSSGSDRSNSERATQRSRSSSVRRDSARTTSLDNTKRDKVKPSEKPPLPTAAAPSSSRNAGGSTSQSKTSRKQSSSQSNPYRQDQIIHQQAQRQRCRQPETLPTLTSTEGSSLDDDDAEDALKIPAVRTDGSFGEFLGVREPITPVNDASNGGIPGHGAGCDDFGSKGSEWELEWIHEEKKAWDGDGCKNSSTNGSGTFRKY
ncbi:hypothetical protein ACHAXS_009298 [Conticribra weissflogii]